MNARAVCLTSARRRGATAALALAAAAAPARAQPLAARVAGAEGEVAVQFATRAAACGDGRGFVALGGHVNAGGGYASAAGGDWSRRACLRGPARVALTVHGGVVTDVRVHVGPLGTDVGMRELGTVGAAEAAAYFLALAGRTTGRAAERAVIAAAVADSAEVWQPLLALARTHADDRVARVAVQWLGAGAPAAAVPMLAAVLRDAKERRPVREGAVVALALAPGGSGVPALAAAAGGSVADGGGEAWVRDRAVFWLGEARDPRARVTLRTLAAADSAPEAVRAQAIFVLGHVDRDADDTSTPPSSTRTSSDANAAFLRGLYPRLASPRLQDRVIQSVAQADDPESRRWLLEVAADEGQPVAARKQALFWAGQQQERPIAELLAVDARLTGADVRRQYAFVLSQREEEAAVERLIAMARTDADPAVRRQAIFWLGQSRTRRARAYLESVVAQ